MGKFCMCWVKMANECEVDGKARNAKKNQMKMRIEFSRELIGIFN